jgi:hypothetical protein
VKTIRLLPLPFPPTPGSDTTIELNGKRKRSFRRYVANDSAARWETLRCLEGLLFQMDLWDIDNDR